MALILFQYVNNTKDKIISIVDLDARVAHKTPAKSKTGYKDHIIIDEDSEIILASLQTPFNTGDHITMANMACNIIRMVNLLCPEKDKVTI